MLTKNISSQILNQTLLDDWEKATIYSEEYSCKKSELNRWQTLRAVCKREGIFLSSNGTQFDWCEAMMELILKPVNRPWARSFGQDLEKHYCKLLDNVLNACDKFTNFLSALINTHCGEKYVPGKMIIQQVQHICDAFRGVVGTALKDITVKSKECPAVVRPEIQKSMRPAYVSAAAETGM
jgi:hypothetical protein